MLLSILLLSISLSIDALGIGSSYGLRGIKIPLPAKLIVAALSILLTGLSLLLGQGLCAFFPAQTAQNIGIFLLILMGFWMIWQSFQEDNPKERQKQIPKETPIFNVLIRSFGITIQIIRTPQSCDMDDSASIDPLEALYLGVALSIDSIGVGFGSGAVGLSSPLIPFAVAVFQVLFLTLGSRMGQRVACFSKIKQKTWVLISGFLLIFIGTLRMFL